jgi:inosine-uridine nucleoside N-ribohydrolase
MGGALDVPGNTSPAAEFNSFADPYAATAILDASKSGLITLIMAPLDITTPHTIPFLDLIHPDYIPNPDGSLPTPTPTTDASAPGPLKSFVSAMLVRVRGLQAAFGSADAMEMHDPLATWYAIAHASLPLGQTADGWAVEQREFKVERTGEYTRGMCVVDRRGTGCEGEDRTKSDRLKNGLKADAERAQREERERIEKAAREEKQRKEKEQADKEKKNLPWVIVETPGSEALRRMVMGRVFGTSV